MLHANEAYLANVSRTLADIVGRPVFEAFPPDEDAPDEHGVPRIRTSLLKARDSGLPDTTPVQKYDVPDTATGGRLTRFWSLISAPVLGPAGHCVLVVQRAEDITDFVTERDRGRGAAADGEHWRRRAEEVQTDLFARSLELDAALRAKDLAARGLASLAQVAFALTSADTVEELAKVVFGDGLPVLGATGGAIAVRSGVSDVLTLTITDSLGAATQHAYAQMPLHGPMPASVAARGTEVLIRDPGDAAAFHGMPEAMWMNGTAAWAVLPLRAGGELLGSLAVGWEQARTFPPEEVELLRAFAAQCAQALDRMQILAAERHAASELQRISQTLQRSLLTAPPISEQLQIAVRYQPASEIAQVGGDWYDAVRVSGGGCVNPIWLRHVTVGPDQPDTARQIPWPSPGRTHGHHQADLVTTSGHIC